jgi:hypothetical protein
MFWPDIFVSGKTLFLKHGSSITAFASLLMLCPSKQADFPCEIFQEHAEVWFASLLCI